MLKGILNIFLVLTSVICIAQKQGNIWYFGSQSGLDFTTGSPVILSNGQTGVGDPIGWQEGTSCISDSSGALMFYTGGEIIWNRNHTSMPNGTGIMGGTSSTQSSLIIPLPGSDSIFYVFTSDEFQSYSNPPQKGYRYSVVNMCLDSGKGDVVINQKNIFLCDSSTEKLTACEDANGTGYWIVGHKMFSNEFQAWHLTSAGIVGTTISKIGTIHGWKNSTSSWMVGAAQGEMKLNSAGNKLALAISNFDPAYLDLFDFDNSTGVVSNFCHMVLDSALNKRMWGCEFSPDDSKLYSGVTGGAGGRRIYQFDMTAGGGNCDSIMASRFTLFQDNGGPMNGMKTAPNGKIYIVMDYWSLNCINSPNLSGLSADFDTIGIPITGQNNYELPNFISGYKYRNGIPCSVETGINVPINTDAAVLGDAQPNPNKGNAEIPYYLPETANDAKIIFTDMLGKTMKEELLKTGYGVINVNTQELPNGIYTYSLVINEKVLDVKKMIRNK